MKRIYKVNDAIGIKVSKRFWSRLYPDGYIKCVGTPSDIRKVCSVLDRIGYYYMYAGAPIMREGRKYQVQYPESWHVGASYTVYRA